MCFYAFFCWCSWFYPRVSSLSCCFILMFPQNPRVLVFALTGAIRCSVVSLFFYRDASRHFFRCVSFWCSPTFLCLLQLLVSRWFCCFRCFDVVVSSSPFFPFIPPPHPLPSPVSPFYRVVYAFFVSALNCINSLFLLWFLLWCFSPRYVCWCMVLLLPLSVLFICICSLCCCFHASTLRNAAPFPCFISLLRTPHFCFC